METLRAADGVELALHEWTPAPAAPPRGSVLVVHGLGEHAMRHAWLAAQLAAAGAHVFAFDQRGHGRSGGARGAIGGADALPADLGLVIGSLGERASRPLRLFGHSLGGLVVARFVAEGLAAAPAPWWRPVDGLMLSSPALDVDMSPLQRVLLAVGALMPERAVANGLDVQGLSRDPAVVRAYVADSLVHDRITPRLARFIVDAGRVVRARAAGWTTPTLVLWAGADRLVAPRGSAQFVATSPRGVVAGRCFEPLFHEIFNEPEKGEALAEALAWLDRQPAGGGASPTRQRLAQKHEGRAPRRYARPVPCGRRIRRASRC
jgi:alpha-beta hydrolase superfamily lysophospholipase